MPDALLVLLNDPAAANGLLAAATCLADLAGGAHITVLAARVPPVSTILPSEQVLTRDKETRLRAQEAARVAALRAIFDMWQATAARPAGATEWFDIEAVARDLVVERGRRADFIVLERPGQHEHDPTWQTLPAALFETDRPVLVVPPEPAAQFGRTVAVAWREDPHATRAVLSALRCATHVASVHLLAGVRPGAPKPGIPEILVEHGIAADLQVIPIREGQFGSALLARAHVVGADMLVMGAFAHSRLRDLVFGGVTRHVLAHSDLPVLMRH